VANPTADDRMPKMDPTICSKLTIRASDYRGERTPWHATQRAAWAALFKAGD
jgi:hypothetical protein